MSQIKKNLFFNIITLAVNIAVGFFYTPYLVKSLGIIAYGVLPLAMILNQYISILTTSLTGTLTRFYSVEINKKNYENASSYLNGALFVILGIIIFCVPILLFVLWKLDTLFNIPVELVHSAKILFLFTFLGFFSSLITSFFSIVLYADNRLDLLNKINIIRTTSKVLFNILFFTLISIDIKFVGIGNFIGESIVAIYTYFLFIKIIDKNIKLNFRKIHKSIFSSLLIMTLWVIIHQLGDLAIYKTDILFINKFWSIKESGILGAISDFGSYIMLLIGVISSLFGPLILIAYSKGDHEEVKKMALSNCLLIGLITSLIVALLIGFSAEFLGLWLGKEYSNYHSWLDFKLISLPFYAASGVFAFVYRSWNKVKFPAIMTVVIGLITVIVTYFISINNNSYIHGVKYILISNSVLSLLQTYALGAFMLKIIYPDIKTSSIVFIGMKFLVVMLTLIGLSRAVTTYFELDNWFKFIIGIGSIGIVGVLFVYFIFISKNDRKYLIDLILRK